MAFLPAYYASITFGGSEQKFGTVRWRVSVADGQAWINAADQAARDATDVGVLMAAFAGLSAGTVHDYAVQLEAVNDTYAFPDPNDNLYLFDKLTVHFRGGMDRYVITIPARDDLVYVTASDGTTVNLTTPAAMTAFIAAFEATALAKNGTSPQIEKIIVSK